EGNRNDRTSRRHPIDASHRSTLLLQEERRASDWESHETTPRETRRNLHRTSPRNRRENIPHLPRTLPQDTSHILQGKITRRIREFRDRPSRFIAGQNAHSSQIVKAAGKQLGLIG